MKLRPGLAGFCLVIAHAVPGGSDPGLEFPQVVPSRHLLYRAPPQYESFAFRDYTLPETSHYARSNYFDDLGNHLLNGYQVYEWLETRDQRRIPGRTVAVQARNLVARDRFSGWSTALAIGQTVADDQYTPLTLNHPGRKFQASSGNWFAASGLDGAVQLHASGQAVELSLLTASDEPFAGEYRAGRLVSAGHGQARVGAAYVGLTALTDQEVDTRSRQLTWRGSLPMEQTLPSFIIVRFSDDSPADTRHGAFVQAVELRVNGEPRPDLQPEYVRISAAQPTSLGTFNRITGQFHRLAYDDGGTKFGDYFVLKEHLAGNKVTMVNLEELQQWVRPLAGGALEANGDGVVLAFFDLRGEAYVRRVEVGALVGNDYRIDVVSLYEADPRQDFAVQRWRLDTVGSSRRARGNVADLSNLKWVWMDAGVPLGHGTWSVNGGWEALGARLRWEYARSYAYRQYPNGQPGYRSPSAQLAAQDWTGARSAQVGSACYAALDWAGERGAWGVEVFHMGPGYDSGLVGDDDDHDGWEDDPEWAALPGNDADHDGRPDTNRNANDLPDYEEPFLLFDCDALDYVYGRDRNHNGVPEQREDDWHPDYPYPPDQEGWHAFGEARVWGGASVLAGVQRARALTWGGLNESTYGAVRYSCDTPAGSRLATMHLVERVRDEIPDDYQVAVEVPQTYGDILVYDSERIADPVEWANSLGHEHWAEATWQLGPDAYVQGNLRVQLNHQLGGCVIEGRDQGSATVWVASSVVRGQYTWRPTRQLSLTGQIKATHLRRERSGAQEALVKEWMWAPIVKLEYELTPITRLGVGMQGLPRLPRRIIDQADPWHSVRERAWVLQVVSRPDYLGYDLGVVAGLKGWRRVYAHSSRRAENQGIVTTYLEVVAGWGM